MDLDATAALMTELVRAGVIDETIVRAAAERCDAESNAASAHQLRCLIVEAGATPPQDHARAERRPKLRVVPDGGNDA